MHVPLGLQGFWETSRSWLVRFVSRVARFILECYFVVVRVVRVIKVIRVRVVRVKKVLPTHCGVRAARCTSFRFFMIFLKKDASCGRPK